MRDLLITAAAAIAAWWMWRRSSRAEASATSVTVRGAKVSVENVEAIEESRVWKYIGPKAWIVPNAGGLNMLRPGSLLLTPDSYYSHQPLMPGKWGTHPDILLMEEKGGTTIYGPSVGRLDPEADQWASWWEPKVLTVGEQLAVGLVIDVPSNLQ